MIERYSRAEMEHIWSDECKYGLWQKIECAVCEAWARRGRIPMQALKNIEAKAGFDIKRISEIEKDVGHDVIAFLTAVAEKVGPDSRYIHLGMTSSDILDTAFALQLKQAGELLDTGLAGLLSILKKRAFEFKDTRIMGRSHGIFAEPTTFGLKLAVWFAEFSRHRERLAHAVKGIAVGKISGAVGTFAHLEPSIEEEVCESLGLGVEPVSNQVVSRDRHAHFFAVLAGIASSMEKVAVEIRHLQRTEVGEAAEPFGKKQKGSSAMPHKRNPILCENLTGLARVVRANAQPAFEDVALWHERDISHSSVERVIAPDSTVLADFMLARLAGVIEGMDVYPEKMRRNLDSSQGLFASQDVLLALAEKGMSREDAYGIVQKAAMKAQKEGRPLINILKEDKNAASVLSEKELRTLFDEDRHFRHVDEIFERVFAK